MKSFVGHLGSRLNQDDAERIISYLPAPLSIDRIRRQETPSEVTLEHSLNDVRQQFQLESDQADQLASQVLGAMRGAVSEQDWREISSHLPGDWADFLESVRRAAALAALRCGTESQACRELLDSTVNARSF